MYLKGENMFDYINVEFFKGIIRRTEIQHKDTQHKATLSNNKLHSAQTILDSLSFITILSVLIVNVVNATYNDFLFLCWVMPSVVTPIILLFGRTFAGSVKAFGREPKSCFGRVFN